MRYGVDSILETDVLIVGAGAAGIMAAIEADKNNVDVIIASKGLFGKSGSTIMSTGGFSAPFGHIDPRYNPKNDPYAYFKDLVVSGCFLNDQRLCEVQVNEAPKRAIDLERMGCIFERLPEGLIPQTPAYEERIRLLREKVGSVFDTYHTYPRELECADRGGATIMLTLNKEIMRRGINVMEEIVITKLLTWEGRVTGATALDLKKGRFVVFKSKAIVIATGGAGNVYFYTSNPIHNTGDGFALAYQGGTKLASMEMVQFHPTGLIWPPKARGVLITEMVRIYGGKLFNARGERYMKRYNPTQMEMATRDEVARASYLEVFEGRGTEHGGVWLDLTGLPGELIERLSLTIEKVKDLAGVDMREDPVEVLPTCHYFMGGILVSPKTETTFKGLFACGEVATGVHGANRMGASSITDLIVFGPLAGKYGAEYARSLETSPRINWKEVEVERQRIFRLIDRKECLLSSKVKTKLQQIMWRDVGVIRSRESLERAVSEIKQIKREELPKVGAPEGSHRYRYDWIEAIELYSLVLTAEMVAKAALIRTESRGAHFRVDYPYTDNKRWLKWIVIQKMRNGKMTFSTSPVIITKLKPKEEIVRFLPYVRD